MTSTGNAKASARAGKLSGLSDAFHLLARGVPPRVSLPQMSFFLLAAQSAMRGRPATFSELREELEEVGPKINSTYGIFFEPSKTFPDGLGWLQQDVNPDDRRQKYLTLTPAGEKVIGGLLNAIGA